MNRPGVGGTKKCSGVFTNAASARLGKAVETADRSSAPATPGCSGDEWKGIRWGLFLVETVELSSCAGLDHHLVALRADDGCPLRALEVGGAFEHKPGGHRRGIPGDGQRAVGAKAERQDRHDREVIGDIQREAGVAGDRSGEMDRVRANGQGLEHEERTVSDGAGDLAFDVHAPVLNHVLLGRGLGGQPEIERWEATR